MSIASRSHRTFLALGASLLTLGACATHAPSAISPEYLEGNALTRNDIQVAKRTEFLEVALSPEDSELSDADRARIRRFIGTYADRGHGPLVLSLPAASSNPQLAVTAVAEARTIAWERGVQYDELSGAAHGAGEAYAQPMILAFQVYDAIAPECVSLATIDYSDVAANNNLPSLGCSVRTNVAAMIADPADLLGNRALAPSDIERREVILEKFRAGEITRAERAIEESGAISAAVN